MRIALFEPDIPQNTGNIFRLGACLGIPVDIIEPAGSIMSTGIPRQAPSLNMFPVFCGMSGSKRAILIVFYYIILLLASCWHIFIKYFFD